MWLITRTKNIFYVYTRKTNMGLLDFFTKPKQNLRSSDLQYYCDARFSKEANESDEATSLKRLQNFVGNDKKKNKELIEFRSNKYERCRPYIENFQRDVKEEQERKKASLDFKNRVIDQKLADQKSRSEAISIEQRTKIASQERAAKARGFGDSCPVPLRCVIIMVLLILIIILFVYLMSPCDMNDGNPIMFAQNKNQTCGC